MESKDISEFSADLNRNACARKHFREENETIKVRTGGDSASRRSVTLLVWTVAVGVGVRSGARR